MFEKPEFFRLAGVVAVSYVALKLAISLLRGFWTFGLAKVINAGRNLKRYGEWAVVTGATDGIGKAYAQQLAKQGINIVLISRTESKLKDVASEIESQYKVKTQIITADFSSGTSIYDGIRQKLQGLNIGILVNNVGLSYGYPEYFTEIEDREKLFADLLYVNCTSVTMMSSIVLPDMVSKKKGLIINISSAAGSNPTPLLTVYSACKAYVNFFSECLEYEYCMKGIDVQNVTPFFVATNMSKVRRASLFIPGPMQYVQSALSTVGMESNTCGYWPHALMNWVVTSLPSSLSRYQTVSTLKSARARALKKNQAKKSN